jgi:hypothetical protein
MRGLLVAEGAQIVEISVGVHVVALGAKLWLLMLSLLVVLSHFE